MTHVHVSLAPRSHCPHCTSSCPLYSATCCDVGVVVGGQLWSPGKRALGQSNKQEGTWAPGPPQSLSRLGWEQGTILPLSPSLTEPGHPPNSVSMPPGPPSHQPPELSSFVTQMPSPHREGCSPLSALLVAGQDPVSLVSKLPPQAGPTAQTGPSTRLLDAVPGPHGAHSDDAGKMPGR